ncbi:hypothetical protein LSTR_LSTR017105 [Laodelphax striatellus]|nr:hypothetical protein LSTR_LSTR017105 [Laodelphax striatellus]
MMKVKEEEEEEFEIKVEKDFECEVKTEDGDDELEAMFDGMPTVVSDKKKSRKMVISENDLVKKAKISKKSKNNDSALNSKNVKKKKVK